MQQAGYNAASAFLSPMLKQTVSNRTKAQPCAPTPIACRDCGVYSLCLTVGGNDVDLSLLDTIVKTRRIYKRGEIVFRADEPFRTIFAVRSGTIKTYLLAQDGRPQITGFHVAGEVLGLNAISTNRYNCEARALETASVCEIPFDLFQDLSRKHPSLQHQMIKILSQEALANQELMLLLGKKSAEERLAAYLLGLSRRFEKRNYSPTRFQLSMSRGDIGNYLGMAEETVCRLFARFQQDGLITIQRRQVRINDLARLKSLAVK